MVGQLHERSNDSGDDLVSLWDKVLTEVANAPEARRQFDLDAACQGQIDGVVRMEAESDPLVGEVVAGDAIPEQTTGPVQQLVVSPAHDDSPERTGLRPPKRRPVKIDHRSSSRVDPEGKRVTPEPVHGDRDGDMAQERPETLRVNGVVQPRGEVHPQPGRLDDAIEGRPGELGSPAGEVVRSPVLGSTVQRHEPDAGTEDALLADAGQTQELREIDRSSLPPTWSSLA
jgi:hypothetical protein